MRLRRIDSSTLLGAAERLNGPNWRRTRPIGWAVAIAIVVALPWLGLNAYWLREMELLAITSLLVSSFNTILGQAGEFALSQVALYAVGAYISGYFAARYGIKDVLLSLVLAIVAAMIVGFVTGMPGLRLGGWSLAMVSFFLVLIVPNCVDLLSQYTGADNGLTGIPGPTLLGLSLGSQSYYIFVVVITALWYGVLRNVIYSPHGNAFLVLKQSPILAASLGIPVYRLKLMAYVLCAIPCGIAGTLLAFQAQFVAPDSFGLTSVFPIIAAGVIGGSDSVFGALIGSAVIVLVLQRINSLQQYYEIVFGAFLVLAGLLFSEGIGGLARAGLRWVAAHLLTQSEADAAAPAAPESTAREPLQLRGGLLEVQHVSKSFGGLKALQDVSLEVRPGQVTALIGPNGSGKTTLLNLICGFYKCTSGTISMNGKDITALPSYRVARAGVVRTFQTPLMPKGMTSRDFITMGRYSGHRIGTLGAVLRLPKHRRTVQENVRIADQISRELGITAIAGSEVTSLPLGTRRLVEVARALSAEPAIFLFDEAASGLDQGDIEQLEHAIRIITDAGGTVLLVEHNFPLVLKLAHQIYVLGNGSLIASGRPEEVERNPRVLEEYVGRKLTSRLRGATPAGIRSGEGAPSA